MTQKEKFEKAKELELLDDIKSIRNTNPEKVGTGIVVFNMGECYDVYNVKEGDFRIQILARSLSNKCRYNGHTNGFYSVAQHCVRMSEAVLLAYGKPKMALAALIHDCAEALLVTGDIVTPLKREFPQEIRDMEDEIERKIYEYYDVLEYYHDPFIKQIDINICNEEMEFCLGKQNGIDEYLKKGYDVIKGSYPYKRGGIHENENPYKFSFDYWLPDVAYERFMSQYLKLVYLIETYSDKINYCQFGSHKEDEEKLKEYYSKEQ